MHNNGKITSQILKNLDRVGSLIMKPRSHHTPPHIYNKFKDKHSIKKRDKVSFAEKLEVIHKLPYDNDFHRNYNCGFQLPQIDAHKYTPLVCRDPYAKPSKKKPRDKFEGMFIGDTARLPFIGLRSVDNFGQKIAPKKTEMTLSNEPYLTRPRNRAARASKKRGGSNIIHFKYSDFMLRKVDRSKSSKMFTVR